jgi:hypothetical protein
MFLTAPPLKLSLEITVHSHCVFVILSHIDIVLIIYTHTKWSGYPVL